MEPWHAIALLLLSLGLMHTIVYLVGFAGQEEQGQPLTAFFHFTLAGYGLVLLTCAFVLWVFGALGLILVLACIAVLASRMTGPTRPPELQLTPVEVRQAQAQWFATIEVRNKGDETVAQVEVKGQGGTETSSATIDYVPAHGSGEVVLGFTTDPGTQLKLRTRSWTSP